MNDNNLVNLENILKTRAEDKFDCRHAYMIIISENEYRNLKESYINTQFYNDTVSYPWCHLKLLTEACARVFGKDNKKLELSICKELDIKRIPFWFSILNILDALNLEKVKTKKGPWYVYANLVLHCGIPYRYFEKLLEITRLTLNLFANDTSTAINHLLTNDEFFNNPKFSKFFKQAFLMPSEKKALCTWLVNYCDITSKTTTENLSNYFPGYFFNFENKRNDISPKSYHLNKSKSCLKLNNDKGVVELFVKLSEDNEFKNENDILINGSLSNLGRQQLKLAIKYFRNSISIDIEPSELASTFTWLDSDTQNKCSFFNTTPDLLVFNSSLELIVPDSGFIKLNLSNNPKDAVWILTKHEWEELRDFCFNEWKNVLENSWYGWHEYVSTYNDLKNFSEIKLPTENLKVLLVNDSLGNGVIGEWNNESFLPCLNNANNHGGHLPPILNLYFEERIKSVTPIIIANFFDQSGMRHESVVKKEIFYQGVKCVFSKPKSEKSNQYFYIEISVYVSVESTKGEVFTCVWFPCIEIITKPNFITFPDCLVSATIKAPNLKMRNNLDSQIIDNNELTLVFKNCPKEIPIIGFYSNGYYHEIAVYLPYVQIFLLSSINEDNIFLEWKSNKPLDKELVKEIYERDVNSRIVFNSNSADLLLLKSSKVNISYDFALRNKYSIDCGEILHDDNVLVECPKYKLSANLFTEINDSNDFNRLFFKTIDKMVYKGKYYNYQKELDL